MRNAFDNGDVPKSANMLVNTLLQNLQFDVKIITITFEIY